MGFLIGPMKFDMDWRWFSLDLTFSSPYDWALICLVSGPSPLGLMPDVCLAMFFVYFWHVSCVIPTCPPTNGKSPKLVEFISYKT